MNVLYKSSPHNILHKTLALRRRIMSNNKKRRTKAAIRSFDDKYRLTRVILGRGEAGEVFEAVDIVRNVEVAVKRISKSSATFVRSKVLKEIDALALCRGQPNILQLTEFFEDETAFFLVFEKMRGGRLLDRIRIRSGFNEAEAAGVVRDLASALRFLHESGIAHRDVKPANVLCVTEVDLDVKLCDFDLCSSTSKASSTPRLQTPVGSLEYMAPEVLDAFLDERDEKEYDKKCDLWSLGVLAHILLVGNPPFVGKCGISPRCGWDDGEACAACQRDLTQAIKAGQIDFSDDSWFTISEEAKDLISKLLEREPNKRISAE